MYTRGASVIVCAALVGEAITVLRLNYTCASLSVAASYDLPHSAPCDDGAQVEAPEMEQESHASLEALLHMDVQREPDLVEVSDGDIAQTLSLPPDG